MKYQFVASHQKFIQHNDLLSKNHTVGCFCTFYNHLSSNLYKCTGKNYELNKKMNKNEQKKCQ